MAKPLDLSKVGTPAAPDSDALYRSAYGTYKDEAAAKSEKERSLGSSLPIQADPPPFKGLK